MKIKFLLTALAGLAFVGCNQIEDDFVPNEIAGQASPITFVLSNDVDDATRAKFDEDINRLYYEQGDIFSLFNNMGSTFPDGTGSSLSYENAVFSNVEGSDVNDYRTKAWVYDGTAIMVYPADVTTAWKTNRASNKIVVSINDKQAFNYRTQWPTVSDFMTIGKYTADGTENTEGYDRVYNLDLKPLGSLLRLTLNPNAEQVEALKDFEITKVELKNGTTATFSTSVQLVAGKNSTLTNYPKDGEYPFKHFKKQAEVATDPVKEVAAISTEDIEDGIAHFVLLPSGNKIADNASIVITTNYGTITVVSDNDVDAVKPFANKSGTVYWSIKDGFNNILKNSWVNGVGKYNGANTGGVFSRTFSFDLTNMVPDAVKTSEQLIAVIDAYIALNRTNAMTVTLAPVGDEFELSNEALEAAAGMDNKLFKINSGAKPIRLEKDVDSDIAALFNSLAFTNNPKVILEGESVLNQSDAFTTKVKEVTNEGTLTINGDDSDKIFGEKFILINKGTLNIAGEGVKMGVVHSLAASAEGEDNSVINIAKGAEYIATSGATYLFGEVSNKGILTVADGSIYNYGKISNEGSITATASKIGSGSIVNGGEIINKNVNATIVLTQNTIPANTALTLPACTGDVTLKKRTGGCEVKASASGYIKYEVKNPSVTNPLSDNGDIFNYLVVTATTATDIDVASVGKDVKHIELNGDVNNITNSSGILKTYTNIIVNVKNPRIVNVLGLLKGTNTYVAYVLNNWQTAVGAGTYFYTGTAKASFASGTYGKAPVQYEGKIVKVDWPVP